MAIDVKIEGQKMIITVDMQTPAPSKSGKTQVVATTSGNVTTKATVNGHPIIVGLNAYYKP
jgi:hypothetical protein